MFNLPLENLVLPLPSNQDMSLVDMLRGCAVPLSLALEYSEEAKLIYCVSYKGKASELILHLNKQMTNITHYEQYEILERGFDVFYGKLTVRNQFQQFESEVRRKGRSEGRMILYDKKNKPFHAQLTFKPIISKNDYDELVLSHYLIEMKRLENEVIEETPKVATKVAESLYCDSCVSVAVSELEGKKSFVRSESDSSAKTSSQSLLTSSSPSMSIADEEEGDGSSDNTIGESEATTSHETNNDTKRNQSKGSNQKSDRKRVYTRMIRFDSEQTGDRAVTMEIVQPEEERLLTKNALKLHDERSLHEMNSTKRTKFMASK